MNTSDRSMEWLTTGLLIVAVAQALLFFWQLRILRNTVADGHKAADAAADGATASKLAADAARESVDMARKQTEDARREFEAERRPWVSVTIAANDGLKISPDYIELPIDVWLVNHGPSPALRVWTYTELVAYPGTGESPYDRQRFYAERVRLGRVLGEVIGEPLFPTQNIHTGFHVRLDGEALEEWRQRIRRLGRDVGATKLLLIGCVDYRSAFGHHQTGFIREVQYRLHASNRTIAAIDPDDTDRSRELISLAPSRFGDGLTT